MPIRGQGKRHALHTAAVAALILLAPTGLGLSATGNLSVEGPVVLPAHSSIALIGPEAVLRHDTQDATGIALRATRAEVERIEKPYFVLPGGTLVGTGALTRSTWTISAVVAEPIPGSDHAGNLGLEGDATDHVYLTPAVESRLEPRDFSRISDAEAPIIVTGLSELPAYEKSVTSPHLYIDTTAAAIFHGNGSVWIDGPDLRVSARENDTPQTWESGFVQTSTAEGVYRWYNLRVLDAEIGLGTGAHIELAARHADLSWQGEASMRATDGTLQAQSGEYQATGSLVTLDGIFTAGIVPRGGSFADLQNVDGDLHTTTLRFQPAPAPSASLATWTWLWIAACIVVIASAAATLGILLARRREKAHIGSLTAEECHTTAMTLLALSPPDYAGALVWLKHARHKGLRLPRLAADEALCLAELGEVDLAIAKCAEAHDSAQDGTIALLAAKALQEHARPSGEILPWLERAVEKSPSLRGEIEREFAWVQDRLTWQVASRKRPPTA